MKKKNNNVVEFDALEKSVVTRFVIKNILVLIVGLFPAVLVYTSYILLQSSLNTERALGTSSLAIDYLVQSITCPFLPPMIIRLLGSKWALVVSVLSLLPYYAANIHPTVYTLLPTSLFTGLGYPVLWTALETYVSNVAYIYSHVLRKPPETFLGFFFGVLFMPLKGAITFGGVIGLLLLKEDAMLPCPHQCGIDFCLNPFSSNFPLEQTIQLCPLKINSSTDPRTQILNLSMFSDNRTPPKIYIKTSNTNVTEQFRTRKGEQLQRRLSPHNITAQRITDLMEQSASTKSSIYYSVDVFANDSPYSCLTGLDKNNGSINSSCELISISSSFLSSPTITVNKPGSLANFTFVDLDHLEKLDNFSAVKNNSLDTSGLNPGNGQNNPHFIENSEIIFSTICLGSTVLGLLFLVALLGNIQSMSDDYCKVLTSTFRLMKNSNQQLLVLPGLMVGMLEAFAAADFSQAFVSCFLGIHYTSLSIISFGASVTLSSVCFGLLSKYAPRFALAVIGVVLQVIYLSVLLIWTPSSEETLLFLLLPALHGVGESAYLTQLSAVEGVLFPNDQEAAFANCRLWEGLGLTIGFAWSSMLCVKLKIYILLVLAIVSFISFSAVEIRIWKENKKSQIHFAFQKHIF